LVLSLRSHQLGYKTPIVLQCTAPGGYNATPGMFGQLNLEVGAGHDETPAPLGGPRQVGHSCGGGSLAAGGQGGALGGVLPQGEGPGVLAGVPPVLRRPLGLPLGLCTHTLCISLRASQDGVSVGNGDRNASLTAADVSLFLACCQGVNVSPRI